MEVSEMLNLLISFGHFAVYTMMSILTYRLEQKK